MNAATLLEVRDLRKAYGGLQVLDGVSFAVCSAEIVGLLGPNGSGKSTLLNAISGFTPVDDGEVALAGVPLVGLPIHAIVGHGVARTFQLPSMPARMSVLEVCCAADTSHHGAWPTLFGGLAQRRAEASTLARANALLEELLLAGVKHLSAGALSGGQKKLLSLACALMGRPRLLMLDEPTAGVHPNLRRDLVSTLQRINGGGVAIVVVEHDMHFVQQACSRCIVLDRGRIVADCAPGELHRQAHVVEAFLGRAAGAAGISAPREGTV